MACTCARGMEKPKPFVGVISQKCQGELQISGVKITRLEAASGEEGRIYFCLL